MIWFTSDTHFGHRNVLRYGRDRFDTIEEMDEHLIKEWNDRIDLYDHVYHLGNVSFYGADKTAEILRRLKGKKFLVRGNHDKQTVRKCADYFEWIKDYHELKHNRDHFVLCHYPLMTWHRAHYGSYMLHGHCHGNLKAPPTTRLDVGVDVWDYKPVNIEEIKKVMEQRTYFITDHHA